MAASPRHRIVFMGTPDFAVPSLHALLAGQGSGGWEVVGVLTKQDRPAGRGLGAAPSAIKQAALAAGLPIQQPSSLRGSGEQAALAALRPDLLVVAAFGLILPQAVLDLPRYGSINVHGSFLPRHRGASPVAAAILAGDGETGATIMRMDAGVDTGPLLLSEALPIAPGETTGSLTPRVAQLGAALLLRVLPGWLAGEITPAPQPVEGVTYAPRVEKEDGRIRWDEPADVIERRTRAYHPWPSAYTTWDGRLLKIVRAAASKEQRGGGPAGTVVHGPDGVGVITGNGVLLLEEVQLAGKRPMRLAEFMPGARGFLGAKLGARETVAPA